MAVAEAGPSTSTTFSMLITCTGEVEIKAVFPILDRIGRKLGMGQHKLLVRKAAKSYARTVLFSSSSLDSIVAILVNNDSSDGEMPTSLALPMLTGCSSEEPSLAGWNSFHSHVCDNRLQ
jgi:hypothetical protein